MTKITEAQFKKLYRANESGQMRCSYPKGYSRMSWVRSARKLVALGMATENHWGDFHITDKGVEAVEERCERIAKRQGWEQVNGNFINKKNNYSTVVSSWKSLCWRQRIVM